MLEPEKLFDTAFLMVGAVIVLYIVSVVGHDAWTAIRARIHEKLAK